MAGLYIHIPFCASRCIYCGFYSTTHLDLRQQYVDAVCHEMELHNVLGDVTEPISTVYIGGGTPSQLTTAQLEQLFIYINKVYGNQAEEITIEANPDDVTPDFAAKLSRLGTCPCRVRTTYSTSVRGRGYRACRCRLSGGPAIRCTRRSPRRARRWKGTCRTSRRRTPGIRRPCGSP